MTRLGTFSLVLASITNAGSPWPFSVDEEHSGSDTILKVLDKAFRQSHRLPDIVFSGHVHNYQRFTRELDIGGKKHEIPYLVIGTDGHWELHDMQKHNNGSRIRVPFKLHDMDDVILETYCDDRYGSCES
jgi:acid phosphatase type 7